VSIAKGLKKERFQLIPQGRKYGKLKDAGELVTWKWENLQARLNLKDKQK
jgi:hypothetical protein